MDSSIEYAKMIEVPVNSCEYLYKRKRAFFKKKRVVKAVNERIAQDLQQDSALEQTSEKVAFASEQAQEQSQENNLPALYNDNAIKKERRANAIISAQVVAIFMLVSAVILTNVFWENSGINTLLKSVFNSQPLEIDDRNYSDFTLTLPVGDASGVTLDNGAINVAGEYSLYPICDGKVSKVERASDGTYTVTVEHSESFSSVTEGLDMVYFSLGEEVSRYMPIGYVKNNAKVYLYNGASLITDYATVENSIVFNK